MAERILLTPATARRVPERDPGDSRDVTAPEKHVKVLLFPGRPCRHRGDSPDH